MLFHNSVLSGFCLVLVLLDFWFSVVFLVDGGCSFMSAMSCFIFSSIFWASFSILSWELPVIGVFLLSGWCGDGCVAF